MDFYFIWLQHFHYSVFFASPNNLKIWLGYFDPTGQDVVISAKFCVLSISSLSQDPIPALLVQKHTAQLQFYL